LNLRFDVHAYAINGLMSDDGIYTMDTPLPAGKKCSLPQNHSLVLQQTAKVDDTGFQPVT
jgi:hypothetical protein